MAPEIIRQVQDDEFDHDYSCPLCEEVRPTKGTDKPFLKSVSVWINKPHVVNRRLCGSKLVHVARGSNHQEVVAEVDKFRDFYVKERNIDVDIDVHLTDLVDESASAFTVIIRELIPKSEFFPKYLEAVVYDKQRVKVTFIPIDQDCVGKTEALRPTKELQYQFELIRTDLDQANEIKLSWSCDHAESELARRQIASKWLRSTLLEKLVSWSEVNNISTSVTSLRLVDMDKYKDTYIRLKNTYGRELVKNWTECTDPKKFVYEDVAIATYLLLIWREDRKVKNLQHKQSFVDLGCGNGLLVYILTKEGHKGVGFDLRKRKIWDTFGSDIDLKEEAITPSADHLYPEVDWIIGNHSDELTPWIPVIAARSSYNTCFFLLPCCLHDFDCKFGTKEKGKSCYRSYMDYVREITVQCGFKPESDTLRIPSTKRVCFIGRERSYTQENELQADARRQAFIDKRTIYTRNFINKEVRRQTSKQAELSNDDCANMHSPLPEGSIEDHSQVSAMNVLIHNSIETQSQEESVETPDSSCPNSEILSAISAASSSQDSASSSTSDKRKYENLDSADSGFYEMDISDVDDHMSTKRLKNDSSNEEFDSSDNCQTVCRSAGIISPICAHTLPHGLNINLKNVGSAPVVKSNQWVKDFQIRVEPAVRNCQTVPEHVKFEIVHKVFEKVLAAPDSGSVLLDSGKTWTKGGRVSLSEAAVLFDRSVMQELKSECGGLQTLLRNHSHVFQVTGGFVQLRDFTAVDPWIGRSMKKGKNKRGNQQDTRKTILCWFDANHPDGCPRTKDDCQFAHGIEELRSKPVREKLI